MRHASNDHSKIRSPKDLGIHLGSKPMQWENLGVKEEDAQRLLAQLPPQLLQTMLAGSVGKVQQSQPISLGGGTLAPRKLKLDQWSNPSWRVDLQLFFTLYGKTGSKDPDRRCSNRTEALRREVLSSTFAALKSRNRSINTLAQFTPRHIPEILSIWSEMLPSGEPRQKPSTQVANFTALRWFWKLHGIKTEPIAHYVTDPLRRNLYCREMVADRDKSWEGNGIDVDEVIRLAAEEDPVLERIIIMAKEFGLRARETLAMDPHEGDGGDRLRVTRFAKGGRQREIPFDPFGQTTLRRVLDELRDKHPEGVRGWEHLTMQQARQRLYRLMRKIGLTRKGLGVTLHGLRAQFAIQQLQNLSGKAAPVRGGATISYLELNEVRRKISQAMGHNRIRVTSAYYGSFDKMAKAARARFLGAWEKLQTALPDIQHCAIEHGLTNLWLVGPLALGQPTTNPEFEFLIDGPDTVDLERRQLALVFVRELRRLAQPSLGCAVKVHFVMPGISDAKLIDGAVPLMEPIAPCTEMERPMQAEPAQGQSPKADGQRKQSPRAMTKRTSLRCCPTGGPRSGP